MSATSARKSRGAAQKKAVEAPAINVEPPPSEALQEGPSLDDAIVDQVLHQFDCSGIVGALAERMASRLATTIKVDDLATRILERRQEKLSAQLVEKLVEKLSG